MLTLIIFLLTYSFETQNRKTLARARVKKMGRHGPMIPVPCGTSSLGVREGDDRVRDGNGSTLAARRTDHKDNALRGVHNF